MNNLPNKIIQRNHRGFTLIEVVLAVAVASIGVIAILGLLPSAVQSARNAADNTLSATIVQDAFNSLRSSPFGAAEVCKYCTAPVVNLQVSSSTTVYYDYKGYEVNSIDSTSAYYRVKLNFENQSPTLTLVTATVVWPSLAAAPINTNIFVTRVAKYDL